MHKEIFFISLNLSRYPTIFSWTFFLFLYQTKCSTEELENSRILKDLKSRNMTSSQLQFKTPFAVVHSLCSTFSYPYGFDQADWLFELAQSLSGLLCFTPLLVWVILTSPQLLWHGLCHYKLYRPPPHISNASWDRAYSLELDSASLFEFWKSVTTFSLMNFLDNIVESFI